MFRRRARRGRGKVRESGYMLLVLMLAVAMLTITLLSVAPNYRRSIRREREVEMIHRGVQYERAVRLYYRKNSSYPPSIERLENTNGIRYLRRRYKDPMTADGAWQIAHPTDVNLAGATGPGATGLTSAAGASGTGATNAGATNAAATSAGDQSNAASAAATAEQQNGGNATPSAGSVTPSAGSATPAAGSAAAGTGDQAAAGGATPAAGPANTLGGAGAVLGGGAMIGVMSKSKAEGIHSFNEKSKYSEWLFIYDPSQDTGQPGHIPNGPYNPKLNLTAGAGTAAGQAGSPAAPAATPPTTMAPAAPSPAPTPAPMNP